MLLPFVLPPDFGFSRTDRACCALPVVCCWLSRLRFTAFQPQLKSLYLCGSERTHRRLPCGFSKPLSTAKAGFPQVFCGFLRVFRGFEPILVIFDDR
jgi:hypothetical protein